ncbi:MAG: tetratricopeptide repeat-containing sulfotransferase family protein [Thermomonas sp.]
MDQAQPNERGADSSRQELLAQAFNLLQQGRATEAAHLSDALLAAHPGDAEVLFLASETRLETEDPESALGFICAAVEAAPGQLPLLLKKADNLIMLRRRVDARQVAVEATAVAGDDGRALWMIGKIYSRCDDPAAALPLYLHAQRMLASHPVLLHDLAMARFFTGDIEGAEQDLEALLAAAPMSAHALYLRSTLRRQTEAHNHVEDLQQRLATGFADAAGRATCLFALAKELEDLGQSEESFAALSQASALKRQHMNYDAAAERESIDSIRAGYTKEVMQAEVPGHGEAGAIFIVGMPRTGTTLLERMLGRHSEVNSAGELLDFGQLLAAASRKAHAAHPESSMVEASLKIDFASLGRDYMIAAREAAGGSQVFIDKMPVNYIYCGLIRKALPKARIIHLVRDPMDSCYAIYKTLFNQAYPFSYDFDELADYYATYHRMMRHWHQVMPGDILDVHYEDLVTDTEAQAHRILEWCGLVWQGAVLSPSDNDTPSTTASAAQVREPVYTSSLGKWRKYEAQLAPLSDRLAAAGIVGVE